MTPRIPPKGSGRPRKDGCGRWNLASLAVGQFRTVPDGVSVPCGSMAHWGRKLGRRFVRRTVGGKVRIYRAA